MAQTPRGITWDKFEPKLEPGELTAANHAGKMIVSATFKPVLASVEEIGFIAVKFVLDDGKSQTVFLDRFAAGAVGGAIVAVNQVQWKTIPNPKGPAH
jgi:hypothetical protein